MTKSNSVVFLSNYTLYSNLNSVIIFKTSVFTFFKAPRQLVRNMSYTPKYTLVVEIFSPYEHVLAMSQK